MSYSTEVHQMFTRCSQVIVDEPFKVRSAILQSVSECRGNRPISPILTLKLVAIATSLEQSEKEGQIRNVRSNIYLSYGEDVKIV